MGEGVDAVSKYAFIDAHRAEFHVVDLCRVGGVSTSGFYDWQARHKMSRPQGTAWIMFARIPSPNLLSGESGASYGTM